MTQITFTSLPLTGGTLPATLIVNAGDPVILPTRGDLQRGSYCLIGWYRQYSDTTQTDYPLGSSIIAEASDIELMARWSLVDCSITYHFDSSDGIAKGLSPYLTRPSPYVETIYVNGTYAVSWATALGWSITRSFVNTGVNTMPDGSGVPYALDNPYLWFDYQTTLYMLWDKVGHTLFFNGNYLLSPLIPPDGILYTESSTVVTRNLPNRINSSDGLEYALVAWSENSDGSGITYPVDTATGSFTVTGVTADLTLYAQWSKVYTLVFSGNGSSSGNMPQIQGYKYVSEYPSTKIIPQSSYLKDGYSFVCWCTTFDGLGLRYYPDDTIVTSTGNLDFFAIWEQSYTVDFSSNTVPLSADMPDAIVYVGSLEETILIPPKPTVTKSGFRAIAWNTSPDGLGDSVPFGSAIKLKSTNLTLYLEWVPEYGLVFDTNFDVASLSSASITTINTYSTGITIPTSYHYRTTPESTGYTTPPSFDRKRGRFLNWNTASDGSGDTYLPGDTVYVLREVITLYAQWSILPRVEFYHAFEGNLSYPYCLWFDVGANYTFKDFYGTTARDIDYKVFTHWSTSPTPGLGVSYSVGDVLTITSNVTLYAHYVLGSMVVLDFNTLDAGAGLPLRAFVTSKSSGALPSRTDFNVQISTQFTLGAGLVGSYVNDRNYIKAWSTSRDGSGVSYVVDGSVSIPTINQTVVLYAVWEYIPKVYYCGFDFSMLHPIMDRIIPAPIVLQQNGNYGIRLRGTPVGEYIAFQGYPNGYPTYDTAAYSYLVSVLEYLDPPVFKMPEDQTLWGYWYFELDAAHPNDPRYGVFKTVTNLNSGLEAYCELFEALKLVPLGQRALRGSNLTIPDNTVQSGNGILWQYENSVFQGWVGSSRTTPQHVMDIEANDGVLGNEGIHILRAGQITPMPLALQSIWGLSSIYVPVKNSATKAVLDNTLFSDYALFAVFHLPTQVSYTIGSDVITTPFIAEGDMIPYRQLPPQVGNQKCLKPIGWTPYITPGAVAVSTYYDPDTQTGRVLIIPTPSNYIITQSSQALRRYNYPEIYVGLAVKLLVSVKYFDTINTTLRDTNAYELGDFITVKDAIVKTDYIGRRKFVGWSISDTVQTTVIHAGTLIPVTQVIPIDYAVLQADSITQAVFTPNIRDDYDIKLYGVWKNIYTLSLRDTDGSLLMAVDCLDGDSLILEGYSDSSGVRAFRCWSDSPSGAGTVRNEGDSILIVANTTLYAVWDALHVISSNSLYTIYVR